MQNRVFSFHTAAEPFGHFEIVFKEHWKLMIIETSSFSKSSVFRNIFLSILKRKTAFSESTDLKNFFDKLRYVIITTDYCRR